MTSRTWSKERLKKSHVGKGIYDKTMVAADLRLMADAVDKSEIVLVTRRIASMDEASDGSGHPAQLACLEWKFPGGKPAETIT